MRVRFRIVKKMLNRVERRWTLCAIGQGTVEIGRGEHPFRRQDFGVGGEKQPPVDRYIAGYEAVLAQRASAAG